MAALEPPASPTAGDDALLRANRLVNRVFAAIMAALVLAAASTASFRYVEAIDEGRRQAGVLADILSEYLVIRLRGVDGALSRIAAENRQIGGPEGSEREWAAALRSAIAGVPGLSSLIILDQDGVVQHATVEQIRGLSWADGDLFQELAKGIPNLLVVDPPIQMVAGNQVLVPFGRALIGPRGDFIGAAVALLLPNQLRDFLGTFDLGETGIAWVLLPSGDVLFRDGALDRTMIATADQPPLFAADGTPRGDGTIRGPLTEGGADYLTSHRETTIGNLIVAVSIADAGLLDRFQREAIVVTLLVIAGVALLLFAARRIKAAIVDVVAAGQLDTPPENSA